MLHPLKDAPKGLKKIQQGKQYVLAIGEHTGHKHLLVADRVSVHKDEQGVIYLNINGTAIVTHEEHKQISVVPGWYRLGNEREFDYYLGEIAQVQD